MSERPYPTTGRSLRTERNRQQYGSMPDRAEVVLQVLYLADGSVSAGALSHALGWPPGITGGVLTYLLQQRQVVRISGGKTMWKLTEREHERQRDMRESRG